MLSCDTYVSFNFNDIIAVLTRREMHSIILEGVSLAYAECKANADHSDSQLSSVLAFLHLHDINAREKATCGV
jgi:hypothetical protein